MISKIVLSGVLAAALLPAADPAVLDTVVIYKQTGRYGGWPANHGAWAWGNELLVGFEAAYFKESKVTHSIDRGKAEEHLLARSLDGGVTWTVEKPDSLKPPPGTKFAKTPVESGGKAPTDFHGEIDFTSPAFAMTLRLEDIHIGPSHFYYSYDRGKTWMGPFRLPDFGQKGIAARTDYLVNGKHDCMLFLTAAKANSREGHVICVRTTDGGRNWKLVSSIGTEPEDYAIMPSTVRLSPLSIVSAVRREKWIEIWRSEDNAASWQFAARTPEIGGNPPSMVRLKDGRLVLTYGYRLSPYGIRARFSKDEGRTWGEEFIIRKDGGTWDVGYPRTLLRPDGKLVTIYYFADSNETERYIAATIWDPGK